MEADALKRGPVKNALSGGAEDGRGGAGIFLSAGPLKTEACSSNSLRQHR